MFLFLKSNLSKQSKCAIRVQSQMRAFLFLGALLFCLSGCAGFSTYYYQPLAGLQRPIAIDIKKRNFSQLKINLNCVFSKEFSKSDSSFVCEKLQNSLVAQGAEVKIISDENDADKEEEKNEKSDNASKSDSDKKNKNNLAEKLADIPQEYRIDVDSKEIFRDRNTWMWALAIPSFTFFPVKEEYVSRATLRIVNPKGFLLATDYLDARFIRYISIPYAGMNLLLNWLFRSPDEKVSAETLHLRLSEDFYGQLSQIILNAQKREQLWLMAPRSDVGLK